MDEDTFEEFSRETVWGTYDGREIPIKDLEDTHILNLLLYLGRRISNIKKEMENIDKDNILYEIKSEKLCKNESILKVINEEIDLRGLDRNRVANGKSLPFKKDGKWMIWKEGDPRPTPIPNSIDFIKPIGEDT